jgi:hypothetical protein
MVKSVQYGVSHNSAWSVETMPLATAPGDSEANREGRAPKKSVVGLDCNALAKTTKLFEDAPRSRG